MGQVSIELTQKCVNRCVHCSSCSDMNCTVSIPFPEVCKVIDDMPRLGMDVLSISGGEPLLYDRLFDVIFYAKKKHISVYVYTSGIVLNHENNACAMDEVLLRRMKSVGVDHLAFDLPAVDDMTYDAFMGTKGRLSLVKQSIQNAVSAGIFTDVHFAKKSCVNQVSFLALVPHGRAYSNRDVLLLDDKQQLALKYKLRLIQDDIVRIGIPLQIGGDCACHAGSQKLCVRYDGRVYGCEAFKYHVFTDDAGHVILPDSIHERSLFDIYSDSAYLRKESEFVQQQRKAHYCKQKCPMQRHIYGNI